MTEDAGRFWDWTVVGGAIGAMLPGPVEGPAIGIWDEISSCWGCWIFPVINELFAGAMAGNNEEGVNEGTENVCCIADSVGESTNTNSEYEQRRIVWTGEMNGQQIEGSQCPREAKHDQL